MIVSIWSRSNFTYHHRLMPKRYKGFTSWRRPELCVNRQNFYTQLELNWDGQRHWVAPKTSAGKERKQLIIRHSPPTMMAFNCGLYSCFCPLLFILSFHCFHRCSFGPEASVFPTLSPVTPLHHKNAGQSRVWGGSGIPHAEDKHSHCQEDIRRSKHRLL